MGVAGFETSRKDLAQMGLRVESLTGILRKLSSETTMRIQNHIDASFTFLRKSLEEEFYQVTASTPTERRSPRASTKTLCSSISDTAIPRVESLEFYDLKCESALGPNPQASRISSPSIVQAHPSAALDSNSAYSEMKLCTEGPIDTPNEGPTSMTVTQSIVHEITTIFGIVYVRRIVTKIASLDCNPSSCIETVKTKFEFVPVKWLLSWTGCRTFLARIGFGQPSIDLGLSMARVVDVGSVDHFQTWRAVEFGDVDRLRELLRRRIAYPTDRNTSGVSLLKVSLPAYFGIMVESVKRTGSQSRQILKIYNLELVRIFLAPV